MDTRMSLEGDGGGRYDTLGRGETVSLPKLVMIFGLVGTLTSLSVRYEPASPPPSAIQVSTDIPHYVRNVTPLRRLTKAQTRAPGPFAI